MNHQNKYGDSSVTRLVWFKQCIASSPFHVEDDPKSCRDPHFLIKVKELACMLDSVRALRKALLGKMV
ncbi:hypothetical protein C4D60_Mb09t27070 [Musa balbisiana]|uniref:Uncharacterized protein n=1 Tax=Musa balbisiana TaxID=52838 RepID=A0A4S8IJG7_MUSBA|nr:hypothetical protein C4D60_Mb09t27070 [Musa balbisiana]